MITNFLTQVDNVLYYPILLIILTVAGIYFMEKPKEVGAVSSFQALMVSNASRVGTGNIIGVSTAICLGGPGAVFWM